jgi:hypothetical protein
MGTLTRPLRLPQPRSWETWTPLGTIGLAGAMYAAFYVLQARDTRPADALEVLYTIPIAILALRFGLRGGIAGTVFAVLLIATYDISTGVFDSSILGYVCWPVTFMLLGALLGRYVDHSRHLEERLSNQAHELEDAVTARTAELEDARAKTLHRLVLAAEYRDDDTFQHTSRVARSSVAIGKALGVESGELGTLLEAAPLHDVGKIAIPDAILFKAGRLSPAEFDVMKTHTTLGAKLLADSGSPVLQMGALIARSHHERWDGSGYPDGLAGERIPLVARIVAVADVFDALTHERSYKPAWSVEDALEELRAGAGSQFDERVVAAFLKSGPAGEPPPPPAAARAETMLRSASPMPARSAAAGLTRAPVPSP